MSADYYEIMALFSRTILMFLIGLEIDLRFLLRNLRPASIIAAGNCIVCTIFAAAMTPFIYHQTASNGSMITMAVMLTAIMSNAASPIVIRFAAELRFANSDFGRLAISSSLISDIYAVLMLVLSSRKRLGREKESSILLGCVSLFMIIAVIILNVHLANWLNRRNHNQKNLKNKEAFGILSVVLITAMALETMGFNSIIACFLIGSMFPRGGKTARTLLHKLNYSVHNFIFPIYLGYVGFQADLNTINNIPNLILVVVFIVLSLGSKISGVLAACSHLNISLNDGVLLAFLMDLKGHVDIVTLSLGLQNKMISPDFYHLMLTTLVINTLIVGPMVAFMVRGENESLGYKHVDLEWLEPEVELRTLACVHNPRHVPTILNLIAALRGSDKGPITPYLMHLIELTHKTKHNLLYNQREDDEFSDEDSYGGNDALEINEAMDAFAIETGAMVHRVKAVSPFTKMYIDVLDQAEDMRASIILLHFHKHQRIDRKMEVGKEGIRTTNQKVLRYAKCSVAILVDRGLMCRSEGIGSESLQHVAILFFGGADDREALGFSRRLSLHHHLHLTIIRFLPASSRNINEGVNVSHKETNVLLAISDQETESEADTAILTDFFNRYVTSGQVGYVEKYVENGAETAAALTEITDMYSLFIVGKGRRGYSPLTTGLSDWEECPELGTVGDLLASSDYDMSGSVLVIQQHKISKNDDE
ncbi:cation/H(+) antiporter 1-like [Diospyros lotus]|uniref:cation/H(+) antiporter 1-like n=1 Tax=Diospyros lotus TaxID=55363 RepID=UPI00224E960C|nr:cation/H(+) antiporter 1-like [Diospyros lotus]